MKTSAGNPFLSGKPAGDQDCGFSGAALSRFGLEDAGSLDPEDLVGALYCSASRCSWPRYVNKSRPAFRANSCKGGSALIISERKISRAAAPDAFPCMSHGRRKELRNAFQEQAA